MRGSARAPRREQSPAANPVPRSASPTARPRAALLPRPGFWAIRTFCARGVLHKDKVLIRPRPRPSIYRLFYRGTGKRRQRKDRAGGYCAPARTVHQSPCACRTAPATDRSSPTAAASGSTFKLPDNLERQSQRFFVDQPVDRHGKAAAAPDFDPAGVGWRGQRFGGRQFDRHEPGHRAAEQLLAPGVELTGPDPVPTRDHRHDGARLRGLPPDRQLRAEEHTSELQSLMRTSYAGFCLKKKKKKHINTTNNTYNQTRMTIHIIHSIVYTNNTKTIHT